MLVGDYDFLGMFAEKIDEVGRMRSGDDLHRLTVGPERLGITEAIECISDLPQRARMNSTIYFLDAEHARWIGIERQGEHTQQIQCALRQLVRPHEPVLREPKCELHRVVRMLN